MNPSYWLNYVITTEDHKSRILRPPQLQITAGHTLVGGIAEAANPAPRAFQTPEKRASPRLLSPFFGGLTGQIR